MSVCADEPALQESDLYDADAYYDALPSVPLTKEEATDGSFTLEHLIDLSGQIFADSFSDVLTLLPGLLLILILGALCSEFSTLSQDAGMQSTASMVLGFITLLYLLQVLTGLYTSITLKIDELSSYGMTLSSVMASFLVFGGGYSSVSVLSSFMVILCAALSFLSQYVFPCVCAFLLVCSIAGVGSNLQLGGAARLISGTYITVSCAVLSILSLIVSFQIKVAAGADSMLRKGAKIASAYTIPVVGGVISESVDNITSGFHVLKNSFGLGSVAVILLVALPCVVSVLLYKMLFAIIGAFCELAGSAGVGRVLAGMDALFNVLLITIVLNAIAYIYCLVLFCGIEGGL